VQSLKYAFRFIGRSFQLAKENEPLQRPWMYQSLGNFIILILWFLPMALVIGLIGFRPIGLILIGLVFVLLVISWVVWGEITAAATCQILEPLILMEDLPPESQSIQAVFKKHWVDIFLFTFILPGGYLLNTIRKMFSKTDYKPPVFIDEHSLIQPIIVLEDLDLNGAVARVEQMAEQHLLRVKADFMRVDLIARVVEWLMLVLGFVVWFWINMKIATPLTADSWQRIFGMGIGLLVTCVIALFGFSFSTFSRTCYHTALYLWARNVESARTSGDRLEARPPLIFTQVLASFNLRKKE